MDISYKQAYKIVESQLGYDINEGVLAQFFSYLTNIFSGNLGSRLFTRYLYQV